MAKRVKMLAPFDVLRGNVSGSQKLEYPMNGQGAYEAPSGKHYAQNYKPRFIVGERQSDGRVYFQVKQRSATNITARSKRAMAVLGGCGAIIGAILKDKTSALYQALYEAWIYTKPIKTSTGKPATFREYLSLSVMGALRSKSAVISVLHTDETTQQPAFITINNPFIEGGTATYSVTISDSALTKFWKELAHNPLTFKVGGLTGIGIVGQDFDGLTLSNFNILDLEYNSAVSQYVKMNGLYLLDGDAYVEGGDDLVDGKEYQLTNVAPV